MSNTNKTPDEIKKGLYCCKSGNMCAPYCPYDVRPDYDWMIKCTGTLAANALALIQQLEDQNIELLQKNQTVGKGTGCAADHYEGIQGMRFLQAWLSTGKGRTSFRFMLWLRY